MKDDRVYLLHMRDAIDDIVAFTSDGEAAFLADKKTQHAVVRSLEILGEAAKRISAGTREASNDRPALVAALEERGAGDAGCPQVFP